jgi:hypothetical protein
VSLPHPSSAIIQCLGRGRLKHQNELLDVLFPSVK